MVCAVAIISTPARCEERPLAVMLDISAQQVHGARAVTPFSEASAAAAGSSAGGAVAMGFVDAALQAKRNNEISLLRDALDGKPLADDLRHEIAAAAQSQQYSLAKLVFAKDADRRMLPLAVSETDPEMALVLTRSGGPMLQLSPDNKTAWLIMEAGLFKRSGAKFRAVNIVRFAYIGRSAPDGKDALAYWSADQGAAYRAEVDAGLQAISGLILANPAIALPRIDHGETTKLGEGANEITVPGRLFKQEGTLSYVVDRDVNLDRVTIYNLLTAAAANANIVSQIPGG